MNNRLQRLIFFLVVWFTMISCLSGWGQNISAIKPKKDFLDLTYPGAPVTKIYPGQPLHASQMTSFPGPVEGEQMGASAQIKQNPLKDLIGKWMDLIFNLLIYTTSNPDSFVSGNGNLKKRPISHFGSDWVHWLNVMPWKAKINKGKSVCRI